MFLIDQLILICAVLVLMSIVSSKFSSRVGVPGLVLFLGLGMLAGSEGLGGIGFEDYSVAHAVGTLALAVILLDGGLSTPVSSIRAAWKPSLLLATLGVLVTSLITGAAASWILNIPLVEGLLLGAIVGSTDAAAVFAILRSGGVRLPRRLSATLEIESGSNDPMAIFLTIGFLEVITQDQPIGLSLLTLFATQLLLGAVCGLGIGYAMVWVANRIELDSAGLYPVLIGAGGLLAYGIAAAMGGSGFLSIYLAGIVMGNRRIVFARGVYLFHDAGAWLAQIAMFVVLGLLSFPSRLLSVAGEALLVAAVLILVARPAAVLVSIWSFGFYKRELGFLSWVGLKGAVPITLATFPFLGPYDLPNAQFLFDVVFFVVLVSALVQGGTIPFVARRLGVQLPAEPAPPLTLEISSLRHVDGDIVDYTIHPGSRAANRFVRELALPSGSVIAVIARGQQMIPPHGNTRILPGDHAILVLAPGTRPLVDKVFARSGSPPVELPTSLEFPLRGATKVGEIEAFYGIALEAASGDTLDELLRSRLGEEGTAPGGGVRFGPISLYVRQLDDTGRVEAVGMVIHPAE